MKHQDTYDTFINELLDFKDEHVENPTEWDELKNEIAILKWDKSSLEKQLRENNR